MQYFSQRETGQDKFIHETFFPNFRAGLVVEVGASDGVFLSNSLFFEKFLGWKSILIEPHAEVFKRLLVHRKEAMCIWGAAYNRKGGVQFQELSDRCTELSGIEADFDDRHRDRIRGTLLNIGATSVMKEVPCFPLQEIFDAQGIKHVHYLSIDTEGSEPQVLQGIDFRRTQVDVITVEDNYKESRRFEAYLKETHDFFCELAWDRVYVRKGFVFPYRSGD